MDAILIVVFAARLVKAARSKGLRSGSRVLFFVMSYIGTTYVASNTIIAILAFRGVEYELFDEVFMLTLLLTACISVLVAMITYRYQMRIIRDAPDPNAEASDQPPTHDK